MVKNKDEIKIETKPLIVETAEIVPVRSHDPEPIAEPDPTTIDREADHYSTTPVLESVKIDSETAELVNLVLRKNPIKRAEAYISGTGEKTIFIYTEDGTLKFIGNFVVTKN